jgi:hypothetical protein
MRFMVISDMSLKSIVSWNVNMYSVIYVYLNLEEHSM